MPKQFSYDEILKVKHAFLTDGEKSYFLELLNDPKQRNIHFLLRDLNPYILFEKAQELIDRVEAGEFDEQQMAVAEYKIVHYLAAIGESEEKIQELYILQSKTDLTKVKNKQEADNQIKEQLKNKKQE